MAFEWMTWAVKQKVGKAGPKAVLIALCNYADEEGYCYPSVQKIRDITEQSDKTVRRALDYLVVIGLLERISRKRKADGTLSVYEYQILTSGKNDQRHNLPVVKTTVSPAVKTTAHNQSVTYTEKDNPSGYPKRPPDKKVIENKPAKPKRKTATRIPEDWDCSVKLGEWAMEQGLTRGEVVSAIENFIDHWRAASGQKARKHDWNAAFRTWIRNEIKWQRTA